jgi:hypothetical protein
MTKLEEVARAIYAKRNGAGARPWARLPKGHRAPYLDDARAAVETLRDMPGRIGDAGYDVFEAWERGETISLPHGPIWRGMIDAILSEGDGAKP